MAGGKSQEKTKLHLDGRVGRLVVFSGQEAKWDMVNVFEQMGMQSYHCVKNQKEHAKVYTGYCPLFEPTKIGEHIAYYMIRITDTESGMVIETFKTYDREDLL